MLSFLLGLITAMLSDVLAEKALSHVQIVQNAAGRVLMNSRECDHITPVFTLLHRLLVRFRSAFKILLLTYKEYIGFPHYIAQNYYPGHPCPDTGCQFTATS